VKEKLKKNTTRKAHSAKGVCWKPSKEVPKNSDMPPITAVVEKKEEKGRSEECEESITPRKLKKKRNGILNPL